MAIGGEELEVGTAVHLATDPNSAAMLQRLREQCQRLVTAAKGETDASPATIRVQNARAVREPKRKAP